MMRRVRGLLGALVAGAIVGTAGAVSAQGMPTASDLLYVCIQDEAKIAVVDMDAREVVRIIDLTTLGFSSTAKPHYVVVEPDGSHWYVSLIGANRVVKFDREDKIVAQFEMETPGMMSLDSRGGRLVISRSMSAVNPPSRVAVVNTATMRGDEVGILFPRPHPMAVAPNGYAYTGSLGVNQIASVSLDTDRVEVVPLEGPVHSMVQFTVSPDGRTLVGSTDRSGQLLVFDLATPARPSLTRAVDIGVMAFDPTFTPDGRFVYVPIKGSNEIAVVETEGWTVAKRITHEAFKQPHQIVFSADGRTAFLTNNNKADHMADPAMAGHEMPGMVPGAAALVVIDVQTSSVAKVLMLGENLTGMGTRSRR